VPSGDRPERGLGEGPGGPLAVQPLPEAQDPVPGGRRTGDRGPSAPIGTDRGTILGVNDTSRITPVRIDANRAAGTLGLEWTDGHATVYDSVTLRWLCPCAASACSRRSRSPS